MGNKQNSAIYPWGRPQSIGFEVLNRPSGRENLDKTLIVTKQHTLVLFFVVLKQASTETDPPVVVVLCVCLGS
jgi:hypothetical protein